MPGSMPDNAPSCDFLIGRRRVLASADLLNGLRTACKRDEDVLTSVGVFLANSIRWNSRPTVAVLRRGSAPWSAVLLHGGRIAGIPTGILRSGHLCGRGTVIARPEDRFDAIHEAVRALVQARLAHTVTVRMSSHDTPPDRQCGHSLCSPGRPVLSSIDLKSGGWKGFRAGLSYKMRRNLSYYRRKAERELGCVFRPSLTATEAIEAIRALLSGRPRREVRKSLSYAEALLGGSQSVVHGLQDAQSRWLSLLTGWRAGDVFYLDWQINSDEHAAASLSTVMRSFCLESEIGRGVRKLVFVGGTTAHWSRACHPETCQDMVFSSGIAGFLIRLLSSRLRPNGELADFYRRAVDHPVTSHRRAGSCSKPWLSNSIEY